MRKFMEVVVCLICLLYTGCRLSTAIHADRGYHDDEWRVGVIVRTESDVP